MRVRIIETVTYDAEELRLLATLGRLTRGALHELANPLVALLGSAELALGEVEPGTRLHDRIALTQRTGAEVVEIVRALQAFVGSSRCRRGALGRRRGGRRDRAGRARAPHPRRRAALERRRHRHGRPRRDPAPARRAADRGARGSLTAATSSSSSSATASSGRSRSGASAPVLPRRRSPRGSWPAAPPRSPRRPTRRRSPPRRACPGRRSRPAGRRRRSSARR